MRKGRSFIAALPCPSKFTVWRLYLSSRRGIRGANCSFAPNAPCNNSRSGLLMRALYHTAVALYYLECVLPGFVGARFIAPLRIHLLTSDETCEEGMYDCGNTGAY